MKGRSMHSAGASRSHATYYTHVFIIYNIPNTSYKRSYFYFCFYDRVVNHYTSSVFLDTEFRRLGDIGSL